MDREPARREIYLDNAATSRLFPEAVEASRQVMELAYGNPSSRHGLGLRAARAVEAARVLVAKSVNATPQEIVFTGGGSEANNLALKGAVWAYARMGRHLVVSAVEHPSVLATVRWLTGLAGGAAGSGLTLVPVGRDGRAVAEAVIGAVTAETLLVSLMHVNNEVGAVQPVAEVGRRLAAMKATAGRRRGLPLFHVDAVQSLGRLPIDVRAWGVDLLTLSAHKIHGPKGVGALFVRRGVRLIPLIHGGGQEAGRRSGTENVPGIAGFGAALSRMMGGERAEAARLPDLRRRLLDLVRAGRPEAVLVGPECGEAAAPHILTLSFPPIPAEVLQHHLERGGVYVSTGSACSSNDPGDGSHVLAAMGSPAAVAQSAIRLSLSPLIGPDEIDEAARIIVATVGELAEGGPS